MKYLDCPLKYTRHTGRTFHTQYKKHIQASRNNTSNSGYSSHILNTGHTYGTVTDTVDIIRIREKGKHLNTLGKCHIYKISKNNLHINDKNIDTHNPIFRTLQEMNISYTQHKGKKATRQQTLSNITVAEICRITVYSMSISKIIH
jgi:hypothetical protein